MKKLVVLAAVILVSSLGPAQAKKVHTFGSSSIPCGENGTISWTPTTLWPPNHKLHDVTFTYSDPDGGDVTLMIIEEPHSDVAENGVESRGSGNTPAEDDQSGGFASDDDGSVDVVGSARAERAGPNKEGRTYRYEFIATSDSDGDMQQDDGCASDASENGDDLTVYVPHDCRGGACRSR